MEVELCPATEADLFVVKNLVRLYVYDMSEHMGWPCPTSGLFGGCDDLEKYWNKPPDAPFLIKSGEELAGFALVDAHPKRTNVDYRVGEFFVLRKFRRHGLGGQIASEVFDRFPGRWNVEALARNTPAVAFWRRVVDRHTTGQFAEFAGTSPWGPQIVLTFENGRK